MSKNPNFRHYTTEELQRAIALFEKPTAIYDAFPHQSLSWRLFDAVVRYLVKENFLKVGGTVSSAIGREIPLWIRNTNPRGKVEPFKPVVRTMGGLSGEKLLRAQAVEFLKLLPAQSIELALRLGVGTVHINKLINFTILENRVYKQTSGRDRIVTYHRVGSEETAKGTEYFRGQALTREPNAFETAKKSSIKTTRANVEPPPDKYDPETFPGKINLRTWKERNTHEGHNGIKTQWRHVEIV